MLLRKAAMVRRRPWLLLVGTTGGLVVLAVIVGLVLIMGMVGGGGVAANQGGSSTDACGVPVAAGQPAPIGGAVPGLTAGQQDTVSKIAGVAVARGLGKAGVLVLLVASYTESSWNPKAADSSGRWFGSFQMSDAWASMEDRLDPVKASHIFIDGGMSAGTPGLLDIPLWWTLDPAWAAEEVEQYGHGGDNYRRNLGTAQAVMDALLAGQDVPALPTPEVQAGTATGNVSPAAATSVGTVAPVVCAGPAGSGGAAPVAFTGDSAGATIPDPTGTGGMITPALAATYAALIAAYPPRSASCWDAHAWNPTSDHPLGKACDVYYGPAGVFPGEADKARGWEVANWLVANSAALNIKYVIWQGQFWQGSWGPYASGIYDVTDPVGGHYDHIHISVTR